MELPTSTLATPSPSTSTIPPALQHSPSPPPLQRSNTSSSQRGKVSPMRRTSGHKVAGGATSTSPTTLREALDQKEEVKRLAQRLATRLQYAAFKVERGWTKHSLPEVENLYWRATKIGTAASSSQPSPRGKIAASASSGASFGGSVARRPSGGSTRPAIARLPSQSEGTKRPRTGQDADTDAGAGRQPADIDEDVFGASVPISRSLPSASKHHHAQTTAVIGLNGLPTPPPSAGTDLAKGGSSSSSTGTTVGKGLLADLRVSPTRQMQAARAASKPSTGGGSTYADFWDKLGASSPATKGAEGATLLASARDKESAMAVRGVKRGREGGEEEHEERRPTGANAHS